MLRKRDIPSITKEKIEKMCRDANMKPETRRTLMGHEVFVADGFSIAPHITYMKFGVEPGEYPNGCYCTIWFCTKGEVLNFGRPMFFEVNHDLNIQGKGARQNARINRALKDAESHLKFYENNKAAGKLKNV